MLIVLLPVSTYTDLTLSFAVVPLIQQQNISLYPSKLSQFIKPLHHTMHTFTLTYLLLAASAHAYYYTATDGSGDAFYAAPVLFEQAALTPNNTNTIPFTIDSFEG